MMHQALGEALFHLKQYSSAVQALRKAVEISPGFVQARQLLANALQHSGGSREAIAIYHEILNDDPNQPATLSSLGAAYFRAGDHANCERYLREAIRLAPKDPDNFLNLSRFLALQQRETESNRLLQKCIQSFPDNLDIRMALGQGLVRNGLSEQAIKHLAKITAARPNDFDAHYQLAVAYHHAKQYQSARASYRRALALKPDHSLSRQALRGIERWLNSSSR